MPGLSVRDSQMGDVEVPIITVRHQNVAVRQMTVSDAVDLYVCRQNIDDGGVAYGNDSRAQLFSAHKLIMSRLQREQITLTRTRFPS